MTEEKLEDNHYIPEPVQEDLVYRLHKRAAIRRQIPGRKSVQEGKPDRIADLFDEAGEEISCLRFELIKASVGAGRFSYVDITTKGCDGWLNLFFDEFCIAMIDNVHIADEMRKTIERKKENA